MAFPFTYFPDPSSSGSAFSLEELERERKRRQLEELTKNSSRMAIGEPIPSLSPQPPRGIEQLATPEQRSGLARFFLGDRPTAPQGDTAIEQYQDMVKKGPGKEGFFKSLGSVFAPRLTRAFSDTYDEKLERLGAAAKMEQQNRQLDLSEDYRRFLREQDANSTNRANIRGDWERDKAAAAERARLGSAQWGAMKAAFGSDAQVMPEGKALPYYGDPDFLVMPWGEGQVMVRKTQGKITGEKSAAKFKEEIAPTQAMIGENQQNLQNTRNQGAKEVQILKNSAPRSSGSSTTNRIPAEDFAAKVITGNGGVSDPARAWAAVDAASNGELPEGVSRGLFLAYAKKILGAKKDDDDAVKALLGGNTTAPPPSAPAANAPKAPTAPQAPAQDDAAAEAKRQIGGKPNKLIRLRQNGVIKIFRTDATGNIREE